MARTFFKYKMAALSNQHTNNEHKYEQPATIYKDVCKRKRLC